MLEPSVANIELAAAEVTWIAPVPLPKRIPLEASVTAPVPPWDTDSAVVRPDRLVISELAPRAAAPRLLRAPAAVPEFVPPLAIGRRPVKVMLPAASRAMLPLADTA